MSTPQFPNYSNPAALPAAWQPGSTPQGQPEFVSTKFHKPLMKLAKLMMKPKVKMKSPKIKTGRKLKKKVAFH